MSVKKTNGNATPKRTRQYIQDKDGGLSPGSLELRVSLERLSKNQIKVNPFAINKFCQQSFETDNDIKIINVISGFRTDEELMYTPGFCFIKKEEPLSENLSDISEFLGFEHVDREKAVEKEVKPLEYKLEFPSIGKKSYDNRADIKKEIRPLKIVLEPLIKKEMKFNGDICGKLEYKKYVKNIMHKGFKNKAGEAKKQSFYTYYCTECYSSYEKLYRKSLHECPSCQSKLVYECNGCKRMFSTQCGFQSHSSTCSSIDRKVNGGITRPAGSLQVRSTIIPKIEPTSRVLRRSGYVNYNYVRPRKPNSRKSKSIGITEQSTKFQKETPKSEMFEKPMLNQPKNNQEHPYAFQPINNQIVLSKRQPLTDKNIEPQRHYNTRQTMISPDKVSTKSMNEIQKILQVEKLKSHSKRGSVMLCCQFCRATTRKTLGDKDPHCDICGKMSIFKCVKCMKSYIYYASLTNHVKRCSKNNANTAFKSLRT